MMQVSSKNLIKNVSAVSLASQEVDRLATQVKDMKNRYNSIKELKSSKSMKADRDTQMDYDINNLDSVTNLNNNSKDDPVVLNKSIGLSIDGQTSTDQLSHVGNVYSQYNSVKNQYMNNNEGFKSLRSNNMNDVVELPKNNYMMMSNDENEPNTPTVNNLKNLSSTNKQNILRLKEQLASENKIESEFKDRYLATNANNTNEIETEDKIVFEHTGN